MDLTPSNLNGMFTNFSLLYGEGYARTAPWWRELATLIPSSSETNTYGWMDRIPKLRKWVGARQVQNVAARSQIVTNVTFELTESVPREKIEDDQYGLYAPLAKMMGEQASKWPDQTIVTDLFVANTTAFDGKAFFATDHPCNIDNSAVGTYDNLDAVALSAVNYAAARAKMMAFKGADGEPLGVMPDLLVVPPSLEHVAREILTASFIPAFIHGSSTAGNVAGVENIWRGSARMLVIPELESAPTAWYLFDTSKVIKPFVFQLREAPQFAYLNRPTDPNVFWNKEFVFGVSARGAATTGLPFLGYKSVG
jgi:phage major head subunit gpT-like protein